MAQPESHNFRLISHDLMSGFGNVGEGMSLQLASGGRRINRIDPQSCHPGAGSVRITRIH